MTELEKLKKQRDAIIKKIERLENEEIYIGVAQLVHGERSNHEDGLWRLRLQTDIWNFHDRNDKKRWQTMIVSDNTQNIRSLAVSIINDLTALVKELDEREGRDGT